MSMVNKNTSQLTSTYILNVASIAKHRFINSQACVKSASQICLRTMTQTQTLSIIRGKILDASHQRDEDPEASMKLPAMVGEGALLMVVGMDAGGGSVCYFYCIIDRSQVPCHS